MALNYCFTDLVKSRESFNELAVSYNCAVKFFLGLPKFYSNHVTCSALDAYTFKHFINIKKFRFAFLLKNVMREKCYRVYVFIL